MIIFKLCIEVTIVKKFLYEITSIIKEPMQEEDNTEIRIRSGLGS
ncbi:hypothetical protein [Dyadobacter subterraneus]